MFKALCQARPAVETPGGHICRSPMLERGNRLSPEHSARWEKPESPISMDSVIQRPEGRVLG